MKFYAVLSLFVGVAVAARESGSSDFSMSKLDNMLGNGRNNRLRGNKAKDISFLEKEESLLEEEEALLESILERGRKRGRKKNVPDGHRGCYRRGREKKEKVISSDEVDNSLVRKCSKECRSRDKYIGLSQCSRNDDEYECICFEEKPGDLESKDLCSEMNDNGDDNFGDEELMDVFKKTEDSNDDDDDDDEGDDDDDDDRRPAKYLGCFKDEKDRDLSDEVSLRDYLTVDGCREACRDKNKKYAAIQSQTQCFCGNDYGKYGRAAESNCFVRKQRGGATGGNWANSVYVA